MQRHLERHEVTPPADCEFFVDHVINIREIPENLRKSRDKIQRFTKIQAQGVRDSGCVADPSKRRQSTPINKFTQRCSIASLV